MYTHTQNSMKYYLDPHFKDEGNWGLMMYLLKGAKIVNIAVLI